MEQDFGQLEAWLRTRTKLGGPCTIVNRRQPKTGFSADTLLLRVVTAEDQNRDIVIRVERRGRTMFLDSSIERQARTMDGLRQHGIPVPALIGWSEDSAILGAPFLIMEHAAGVSLPQHPSYHVSGLLLDLDGEARNRAWRAALSTIARINRIEWRGTFDFLLSPSYGAAGLDHYLGWARRWRDVACDKPHPLIDAAFEWLETNRPNTPAAELLWGDSNPGNLLFSPDGSVSAALDFEAASIGPAEVDLGWWFVLDEMLAAGANLPPDMPDKAGQIVIFEEALGRAVRNLDYFEVLAAVRMTLVIANTVRMLIDDATLPATNQAAMFNPAASMLARMIGVTHDARLDQYMALVMVMNKRA